MKHIKQFHFIKTLALLLSFALYYTDAKAQQCIYTDDFERSGESNWDRPNTTSSADGWYWNSVRHREQDGLEILRINGGSSTRIGYIISPVFNNGCSNIKFSYQQSTSSGNRLKVDILQADTVSWTKNVDVEQDGEWHEISEPLSIAGNYQLRITNTSNGGNGTGQRVINIKSLCITTLNGDVPAPAVGIEGIAKEEGGFWDNALITLSFLGNKQVYYTTDGTEPAVVDSLLYTEPFALNITTTVKAIAVADGTPSAVLDTLINVSATTFRFVVPENTHVFVGDKSTTVHVAGHYLKQHYIPFAEKEPVYVSTSGGNKVFAYNVSGLHNYRVSKAGALTHVGTFTPNASNKQLMFTNEQLALHSPKEVDYDVNNLNGRNMADIFLNINAQGHLNLSSDTTFQLINLRNWQAIDTDVNNYFIEPDFYYTVLNENGEVDNSVVTISDKGVIQPVGTGTAFVLVGYDAMMCAHTRNVGNNGAAFFGAIWPENTGVFAVSVDEPESAIKPNMFIGEYWNSGIVDKVDSVFIDAEHDILYYEASTGGFDFTFTPEGVTTVTLAQPILTANTTTYTGFSTEGVTAHSDGSYTVRLVHGRNMVKLTAANGQSVYQVISAKPVTYTISNFTNPGEGIQAGDEVVVSFSTLFHPSNKLSGIYNMSAGIQYAGNETNFPLILGPGQYTFASRALDYKIRIPADYDEDEFVLTNGVIKVQGFGSPYGAHRNITLQNGVSPNLNASVRTAFFGSLPDVRILLDTKLSTPTNLQATADEASITLTWDAAPTSEVVDGYLVYVDGELHGTTTDTEYVLSGLSTGVEYFIEVEAYNENGKRSERASVTQSLLITSLSVYDNANLKIYPNPFADYIVVNATQEGQAVIYDLTGKALLQITLTAGDNRLNTQTLENGSYLLKSGEHVVKLVK